MRRTTQDAKIRKGQIPMKQQLKCRSLIWLLVPLLGLLLGSKYALAFGESTASSGGQDDFTVSNDVSGSAQKIDQNFGIPSPPASAIAPSIETRQDDELSEKDLTRFRTDSIRQDGTQEKLEFSID